MSSDRASTARQPSALIRSLRWINQTAIDLVLWILGALGLLSLLAAIAAQVWGLTIILFSTGSMSPTIPAGSAALVQRAPASSVHEGDIVTISRKDALPVTHRVRSVTPAEGSTTDYVIVMRGDANQYDDVNPYRVSEVRRVLFSVPGVAEAINKFRDPRMIAGLTLIAGVLVTWAFWPRRRHHAVAASATEELDGADEGDSVPAASDLDELLGAK